MSCINSMAKNNVSTLVALFFLFPVYAPAQDTIIPPVFLISAPWS
jgi:hypothetical protein